MRSLGVIASALLSNILSLIFSTAASFISNTSSNNWANYTLRVVIDTSVILAEGNRVRITIQSDTDKGCNISKVFIGKKLLPVKLTLLTLLR